MALELPKLGSKEKKGKPASAKNDTLLKFMEFFDKNPIMKVLIPVVLFIILVALVLFLVLGDGILLDDKSTTGATTTLSPGEVLVISPENNVIKDKEIVELIESDPLSEDILASAQYQVYFYSSTTGAKTATLVIGSSGESIVLRKGDKIGSWELIEIAPDYVIFEAGDAGITKTIKKQ